MTKTTTPRRSIRNQAIRNRDEHTYIERNEYITFLHGFYSSLLYQFNFSRTKVPHLPCRGGTPTTPLLK
jgi:hypothetical protein